MRTVVQHIFETLYKANNVCFHQEKMVIYKEVVDGEYGQVYFQIREIRAGANGRYLDSINWSYVYFDIIFFVDIDRKYCCCLLSL